MRSVPNHSDRQCRPHKDFSVFSSESITAPFYAKKRYDGAVIHFFADVDELIYGAIIAKNG